MKRMGSVGLVLGVLALGGMTACEEKPDPVKVHRAAGTKHFNRKEWKQAAAEYEKSLAADPKQDKIWEAKAYAHLQDGDQAAATATMLKHAELKATPEEKAEILRNIANMYMKAGPPFEEAEKYFLEALKLAPKDEATLGWLAEIYSSRGGARSMNAPLLPENLEKAVAYYDQVLALNPNSANSYLNKRIVVAKYMEHERIQKDLADVEAQEYARRDRKRSAEAKARAEEHAARMLEYKAQIDELTKKFSEAFKASKAAAAAPAEPAKNAK